MNAVIYARGNFTDEEFERAKLGLFDDDENSDDFKTVHQLGGLIAQYYGLGRYFDTGYSRGDWVSIHERIMLFRAYFPNAKIHYVSDASTDPWNGDWLEGEATDERIAELWAWYAECKVSQ